MEADTIKATSEIDTLEPVEPPPDTIVCGIDRSSHIPEKNVMLMNVVEENGGDLSSDEKELCYSISSQPTNLTCMYRQSDTKFQLEILPPSSGSVSYIFPTLTRGTEATNSYAQG